MLKRNDMYVVMLIAGAYATAGNIPAPPPPPPCCPEHEVREDGSTPVANLDICERQKVTGVVTAEGQPPVYVKLIWDGDAPLFRDSDVHRFINGWEEVVE